MADQRCRVTVIGTKHQADVAIPAQGPIGEYAHSLAGRLDEPETDGLPAAWSLKPAGGRPLPPHASLDSAGVTDGQLLYLCDLTEGEHDEPLLLEVDECVARTVDRIGDRRWTPAIAGPAAIVMSVLWLVAGVASWLVTARASGAAAAGFLALAASIALAVTAWLGQAERLGLIRPMRLLLAIAAVPCLAVTGWFAGLEWAGGYQAGHHALGAALVGLAIGLLAGAMAALSAMPGIETLGLAALATLASSVICLLVALAATAREVTAVTAVAGYWLVAAGPGLSIRLAATWEQFTREDTERAVVWARVLTLASTCVGAAVTAVALVLMASVRNPFDIALAAVLSSAMLLRAGTCKLLIEAIPIIIAGLLGLFAFAMEVASYLSHGGLVPALTDCGLGLLMLGLGVLGTATWPAPAPGAGAVRPGTRLSAAPSKSQLAIRVALTLCSVAALPLMLGTFGLYARFISLGHHL